MFYAAYKSFDSLLLQRTLDLLRGSSMMRTPAAEGYKHDSPEPALLPRKTTNL